jgi:hypothetical protein
MKVAMQNVTLDTVDFIPAVVLASDVTTQLADGAERTLTFNLLPEFNTALHVGADPAAFFQNFYTLTLSQALVAPVVAFPVLVT